jgi:exodeoxyribonuclease-1
MDFVNKTPAELAEHWRFSKDPDHVKLPVKTLKYNRCPAVAPLGVLDQAAQDRLKLPIAVIAKHREALVEHRDVFVPKIIEAVHLLDEQRKKEQSALFSNEHEVDERLYDGFFSAQDKTEMRKVRGATPAELSSLEIKGDERLTQLLPLYKARNYPGELTTEERQAWDAHRRHALQDGGSQSRLARFARELQKVAETFTGEDKRYLIEELQLYAESIVELDPADADSGEY